MNVEDITNSIREKLGEEESGKIADDLASLLLHDKSLNDTLKEKESSIEKLKNDKDLLVNANANLLLKIPSGKVDDENFEASRKDEENPKVFDFRSCFKDGRFMR